MISRNWRGVATHEAADKYVRHLQLETFPELSRIPGFVSASILRRPTSNGVEFLIVTTWESMDAIRLFAGARCQCLSSRSGGCYFCQSLVSWFSCAQYDAN